MTGREGESYMNMVAGFLPPGWFEISVQNDGPQRVTLPQIAPHKVYR